jgi:hypothetical protein
VTLIAEHIDPRRQQALLVAGVEVIRGHDQEAWLAERAGHYSHVVLPPEASPALIDAARRTQSAAVLMAEGEVERELAD